MDELVSERVRELEKETETRLRSRSASNSYSSSVSDGFASSRILRHHFGIVV